MTISIQCACGKKFRAKDEHAGKRTKCPDCGRTLTIGASVAGAPPHAPAARPIADAPLPRHPGSPGVRSAMPVDEAIPVQSFNPVQNERPGAVPPQVFVRSQSEATDAPLDAGALEALKVTESYRRPIRHAAILFRIQFLFGIIALALSVIMFFVAVEASPRSSGSNRAAEILGLGLIVFACGAIDVLLYFTYKATWDSQRWAPMVMLVLNALAAVFFIGTGLIEAMGPRGDATALVAAFIAALGPAIVGVVCYRAWDAIPRFLGQPAWCRHALLHCKL